VEDIALMLDSMVGHDIGDPLSFNSKTGCFIESLKKDLNPISIAVSEDLNLVPVDSEVRKVFKTAIKKLSKLGLDINDDIPNFFGVLDAFKTLRGVLMASMLGDLVKNHKDSILEDIRKNVQVGFDAKSLDIIEAEKIRRKLIINMENFFKKHNFLICPSASVPPFSVDKPFVTEIDGHKCETYIDWFSITFAITMTSCPTLCIPCGFTEKGLPIGIQVVAAPRQEASLINFGHKLQTIFGISNQLPISPRTY